ncbi:MAG: fumarylacetoacetase [Gemmatimonadaceae bacterium]|nr:fumarylacetoacetase [Gemmatimonadaceae bacterium]MDQ3517518.1 fumarylacetoacetase [Gemmatimonadota bacterium]
MNESHDPHLECWVRSAHNASTDFPIQNLPFGIFRRAESDDEPRVGVAIGDQILDVTTWLSEGLFDGAAAEAAARCALPTLNALMALGNEAISALRRGIVAILSTDGIGYENFKRLGDACLTPVSGAQLFAPVKVGDYTDFYASVYHATNVGSMFRPDNPLLPNYKFVPIGYHGRASSIVASGTEIIRPRGQTKVPTSEIPTFGPSRMLDYESELGFFVGRGNTLGAPIPIQRAAEHIFGFCLVNDWSARDIQAWEYQPLGPFLAKSFATSTSPWVVTAEAIEPFRAPAFARDAGDPAPLDYLSAPDDQKNGGIQLFLEVWMQSAIMRDQKVPAVRLSRTNFGSMYWTPAQMLAHHASNGCNLRPGDLLGSGTVSGKDKTERGCLLELTWRGAEPVTLPTGEQRRFLEDGDEVIMRGYCERDGFARIGFGDCRGIVSPAAG